MNCPPGSSGSRGLRAVFLGTPRFAVPVLESLATSQYPVALVVTGPDRPSGRGLRPRPSEVRVAAERLSLPVETVLPEDRVRLADLLERVRPEVVVTAAWSGLLDGRCLGAAQVAALNVHPSLLPRYRGAAPVQRAMLAGERRFGVTVMHLDARLDAGDIVLQEEVAVPPGENAGRVTGLLAAAGGDLLVRAMEMLARGEAPRVPQDELAATWAPKLTPEDERITWEAPAGEIVLRVLALSPEPGAYFMFRGRRVKIVGARDLGPAAGRATALGDKAGGVPGAPAPGTIVGREGPALAVIAGSGTVVCVERVKPAGGREISGADFANGRRLASGDALVVGG